MEGNLDEYENSIDEGLFDIVYDDDEEDDIQDDSSGEN
jgi:hypothetical protein